MNDLIYTRNDGHAFGLERSGFKIPTRVKDRAAAEYESRQEYEKRMKNREINDRFLLDEKHNPLLKKKVRHG